MCYINCRTNLGAMPPPACPWAFMAGLDLNHDMAARDSDINSLDARLDPVEEQQTFSEKVRGNQPLRLDVEALPSPVLVGDVPMVTLPKKAVERGKEYCRFSLIGRLDFRKISILRARTLAEQLWSPTGDWKLIPLGNGFFMLKLNSQDEFIKIWSQSWNFGNQVVRFSKWSDDFDPDKQRSSSAVLWVRFPKLKQQYWDYELLMVLGKGLGTPIGVDQRTINREYGYFANVLVDIDLSKPVPSMVKVREEGGVEFSQPVEIPKLPAFCNHCKLVGHLIMQCKGLLRAIQEPAGREDVNNVRQEGFHLVRNRTYGRRGNGENNTIVGQDDRVINNVETDTVQEQGSVEAQGAVQVERNGSIECANMDCNQDKAVDLVRDSLEATDDTLCRNSFAVLQNEEEEEDGNVAVNQEAAVATSAPTVVSVMEQPIEISEAQKEILREIELVKVRLATPSLIPRLPGPVGLMKEPSSSKSKAGSNKNIGSSSGTIGIGRRTRQNLPNIIN